MSVVTRFAVALRGDSTGPPHPARSFGLNGRICTLVARCLLLTRWYHEEAMYYRHFRLTGPPFEAVTGSETVYLSRAHRESLAALEWGLLYEPSGFTTLSFEDILRVVLGQFGIQCSGSTKLDRIEALAAFLGGRTPQERLAIIVDEAQDLSDDVLEEL